MSNKISAIVVTYRRLQSLERVLEAWLNETPDVWLCDCSRDGFETNLPITIVRANPDPGNKIRHAVATMTKGEYIIKADDDIIPFAGLGVDFIKSMQITGPAILGVHGRIFRGPLYYKNTKMYGSKGVHKGIYEQTKGIPQEVDFVGVTTCTPREFLAMDLKDCETEIEDLYWQMEKYPKAKKYIIPTLNYMNLEESRDEGRLCAPNTKSREIRQAYYKKLYERNYANRKK